jgi:hypothetical protein
MSDEELARATIACRRCGAEPGSPCHNSAGSFLPLEEGGPLVHPARLHDWQDQQGTARSVAAE